MLERFLQIKEPLESTLALVNPQPATLVVWETLKEACNILKPFEEVAVEMSSERYVNNKVHQILFRIHTVLLCSV